MSWFDVFQEKSWVKGVADVVTALSKGSELSMVFARRKLLEHWGREKEEMTLEK